MSWRSCSFGFTGPAPSSPPGIHNRGRCWGGPTQPWVWACVVVRLVGSSLQCPCHQGQLSCFAEEREGPAHLSATAHKGKEQAFLHRPLPPHEGWSQFSGIHGTRASLSALPCQLIQVFQLPGDRLPACTSLGEGWGQLSCPHHQGHSGSIFVN